MARGPCHCAGEAINCAGVRVDSHAITRFLFEVARSLNKTNPNAFALLHGRAHGFNRCVEQKAREQFAAIASRLQEPYPELEFYELMEPARVLPSTTLKLSELVPADDGDNGKGLEDDKNEAGDEQKEIDPAAYTFAGLLIKVKGGTNELIDFSAKDNVDAWR